MNDRDLIDLQKWWMNELKLLTQKVMNAEDKRQAKVRNKKADILADADVERKEDIDDLYAYGVITAKKREKLLNIFEEIETPGRLYREKLDMLQDMYQIAKEIIRDKEAQMNG